MNYIFIKFTTKTYSSSSEVIYLSIGYGCIMLIKKYLKAYYGSTYNKKKRRDKLCYRIRV